MSSTNPRDLFARLSNQTMAGVIAFAAVLGVAAVDHEISSNRLTASLTDTVAIQQGFDARVGLYVVGLALAVAYICIAALRSGTIEAPRVFNNLGIAGVCVLAGTLVATFWSTAGRIELPHITPWLLGAGMVVAGTIGRLATLRETPPTRLFPWQTSSALGVTALVLAVAFAYSSTTHGCYTVGPEPPSFFAPLALANAVLALACLATRRWIAALVGIVGTVFASLVVVAASGALC